MTHRIAVIGGDGIGPEVTAEALKVVRAAGVDLDTTAFDLGGARYLRDGTILPDEVLGELRTFDAILLGAVGTPEVPPGVIERGLLAQAALRPGPLRQPATVPGHGTGPRPPARLHRHPGEHRGALRGRGGPAAQGHAARGGDPGQRQHPPRRRALRPLRLRAGAVPAAAAPDPGAQDQRAHLRRGSLAADLRRGRRRAPRRRPPPTTTSTRPASTSCRIPTATT